MKTEKEIREHLAKVEWQVFKEVQLEHKYLEIVGRTTIEVLKWVLEDK